MEGILEYSGGDRDGSGGSGGGGGAGAAGDGAPEGGGRGSRFTVP